MITAETFVSGTLKIVDAVIADFVSTAFNHFIQANAGFITLLFTVYIMFLGFQFLTHTHHFSLGSVLKQLILMLCVYALVMNWKLYHLFVFNIFTNEPGNIANILIKSAGVSNASIADALDKIYVTIINATLEFFRNINFSTTGLAFVFYGLLVFIIGSLLCVFALLLFIYAKMMMAVSLALGPIFILFLLWNSTKGLFSAWLNKLITVALIPVVTTGILVLMLSVINITLPKINQPIDQLQFYGIAPFLGLALATTLILSQVFRICSSLGGGITLASLSKGSDIAQSTMQKSGINYAGRAATSFAKNKTQALMKRDKK